MAGRFDMTEIDPLLEAYLCMKRQELTSDASYRDVEFFACRWFAADLCILFPAVSIRDVTEQHLRQMITHWETGKAGHSTNRATIRHAVKLTKHMFRRLYEHRLIDADPAALIVYRRRAQFQPTRRIPNTDVARLLAAPADTFPHLLQIACAHLLLDTGLRAAELCHLRLDCVQLPDHRVRVVKGKGQSTGYVAFSSKTAELLRAYLEARDQLKPDRQQIAPELMFVNGEGRPLRVEYLNHQLKQLASRVGVQPVAPHEFRVTFAVLQFHAGATIPAVQAALRHSSVAMTMRYFRIYQQEIAAMLCAMKPVTDFVSEHFSASATSVT
jgi:site-specific recombinase XerD